MMKHIYLAVFVFVGVITLSPDDASSDTFTIDLLDPMFLPQEQGWSVMEGVVGELGVSTTGSFITSNTIGLVGDDPFLPDSAFQWFFRDIPFVVQDGFSIDFLLRVNDVQAPHNLFDAGIVFYGSTTDPNTNFTGGPRTQFIFFDKDRIGWGDESQSFAMNTTDNFHLYRLTVDSLGFAQVFVDNVLALEKSNFVAIPRIGFGDMTNDPALNGSFSIASVSVTGRLAPTTVSIDIKPDSHQNIINPHSHGNIAVAIFTTDLFDASAVDDTTVRFGTSGSEAVPLQVKLRDVDGDMDTDMVLQFNIQHTDINCGDSSAFLTGETLSGIPIQGSDSIRTVGCTTHKRSDHREQHNKRDHQDYRQYYRPRR